MSRELAKLDISEVTKGMREKIRAAFVDAIPDEMWSELMRSEWKDFTREENDRWRGRLPSGFSVLCQEVLQDMAREKIRAMFSAPEWEHEWGKVSDHVLKMLGDNAEKIVQIAIQNTIGSVTQQMLDAFRDKHLQG